MGTVGPNPSHPSDQPASPNGSVATITPASAGMRVSEPYPPESLPQSYALDGSAGDGHRTLREAAFDALLPRAGRIVAGKYRVDELMARGGMGAVYAATHQVTGKRLAIKWMLPSLDQVPAATERFVREAQATARINHPNVVDIYDVGQEGGSFYLVMELLHGETLRARMRHGPMLPHESIGLLMPALRGVAAAHAHRVVHRDLKPDNIFLCAGPDGEPREAKVLDFGISKVASDSTRDVALTQSGTVLGTPYYMAPEQVRGLRDVDARADVYAFGVILYELLSGRRPFEADSYNGLILQIATERPVPLHLVIGHVPEALSEIVHCALARAPADRYQSVNELAAALEPFAGGVAFRVSLARAQPIYSMPTPLSGPALQGDFALSDPAAQPARATPAAIAPSPPHRRTLLMGVLALASIALLAVWLIRGRIEAVHAPLPPVRSASSQSASTPAISQPGQPTAGAAARAVEQPALAQPSLVPASAQQPRATLPEASAQPSAHESANGDTQSRGHRRNSVRPGQRTPTPLAADPVAQDAAESPDTLPEDWDVRLKPAVPATDARRHPAGDLGESDFR